MKKINSFFIFLIINALLHCVLSDIIYSGTKFTGAGYIFQDFENPVFPPAGWDFTVNAEYNYKWHRTTLCGGYGIGTAAIKAVFIFTAAYHDFEFTTIIFNPSSAGDTLKFDHAYASYTSQNDLLEILTSSNNGVSWSQLIVLSGGINGPLVTAGPQIVPFVPTSSQWATKKFALPIGTNKIKFIGHSAGGNTLYLDNLIIGSAYSVDVGAAGISSPQYAIKQGNVTPKVIVKNYGNTTQSFQVYYNISPGNYIGTESVNNLAAGQSQQISFSNYNFTNNGTYTLKAYTSLRGDQNNNNDTIYSTVIVTPAPRNVLLEYCTGTWCSWCPCAKEQALLLLDLFPNSAVLAYHGPANSADPFRNFNGNEVMDFLDFFGYPTGIIDRTGLIHWSYICTVGESRVNSNPAASVNLILTNQNYNINTRELTVSLDATAMTSLAGQYKINYVITEDNIIYPQTGSACPGGEKYIHLWVVRNMVNGALGENINSGSLWNMGQTYSKSFSSLIDTSWIPVNCNLQLFIYKESASGNISGIQQCIKTPIIITTGINNQNNIFPLKYELSQNYPNPFNPVTNIKFAIPKAGNVSLKIYDITGKLVAVYLDGYVKAGYYNAEIDGTKLSSGVYFYKLSVDDMQYAVKKMVLVK